MPAYPGMWSQPCEAAKGIAIIVARQTKINEISTADWPPTANKLAIVRNISTCQNSSNPSSFRVASEARSTAGQSSRFPVEPPSWEWRLHVNKLRMNRISCPAICWQFGGPKPYHWQMALIQDLRPGCTPGYQPGNGSEV